MAERGRMHKYIYIHVRAHQGGKYAKAPHFKRGNLYEKLIPDLRTRVHMSIEL